MQRTISRRQIGGLACGAISGAALGGQRSLAQTPIVMKLGTATINDTQQEWLKRFADTVERDSGGRIKGEVYPASQLGQIPRMIEGTQFGQIQGWIGPPEFLAGVDERYEVLSAPGLVRDLDHARKALSDPQFRDAFLKLGANKGLKAVDIYPYSTLAFIMRSPVRTIDGFKGAKIRVLAASLQLEQIRRLGASPVPMPLGEVLTAVQQGAIDGVMTAIAAVTPMRFYDAAKYAVETDHAITSNIVVLSKSWFDKLPADLQSVVANAGTKTGAGIFDWAVEYNKSQEKLWQEKGGEIIKFSPEQKAELAKLFATVLETVLKNKPDVKALYEVLVAAANRTR